METRILRTLAILLALFFAYAVGSNCTVEAQAATIGVSNIQGNAGVQVNLPVSLTQHTNIAALQFTINFDSNVLTAISVASGPALTDHTLISNIGVPGQVTVGIFSGSNASIKSNSGSVVDIIIQVASGTNGGTTTPLNLSNVILSDTSANSVPVTSQNGTFTVNPAPPATDIRPPLIFITSPGPGATVAGSMTVSAQASDNIGVAGVQFKLDGQNLGTEDTTAPYSVSWNTIKTTNGSHKLTAIARDAAGNQTPSAEVLVTVKNRVSDTTAPSVSITSPIAKATVSRTIAVSAKTSDNTVGVQFKLDGQNLGTEDTTAPYSVSWNTIKTTNGSHKLTAIARDAAGNQTPSAEVLVTVKNRVPRKNPPANPDDSAAMGALASSMKPGTWAELNTNGLNGAFLETEEVGSSILSWADKAVWDPNSKRLLFLGAPPSQPGKLVIYDDQSNSWQSGPLPPPCMSSKDIECIGQAFQHNAVNPGTGDFYYRGPFGISQEHNIYSYNIESGTWTTLPPNNVAKYVHCCGALEYFPEMNGLVYVNGTEFTPMVGGLYFLDMTTKKWARLVNNIRMADCCGFASYNPVHKVLLFGGGTYYQGGYERSIYKLDSSGKVTKLNPAPIDLAIPNSVVTVDPVSGKYLVFGEHQIFYEYDITTDTWTLQKSTVPLFTDGFLNDTVATPVGTYGVVMFVKYWFGQSKVYLYKHALNGGADR